MPCMRAHGMREAGAPSTPCGSTMGARRRAPGRAAVVLGRLRSVRLEDREHTSSDCPVRRMHFIALNMHTLSPQHPAASRAAV